ncbi:MAG: agmatinase [Candidatus Norongarragalinales archaeon]
MVSTKAFLDFPQAARASARYCVLPVAFDATATYKRGARHAPRAIIEASAEVELFDEELKRPLDALRVHTLPEISDNADGPEKTVEKVEKEVAEILPSFPLVLGGEHSVSIGGVRAAIKKFSSLTVLYFDAHADLRDEFEGSRFNHACAARRMLDAGARLVQVGVRSLDAEQFDFVEKMPESRLKVFWMQDLADGVSEKKAQEIARVVGNDATWISFDVDAFDPSEVPNVGTPEPGGLHWRDVLRILRTVMSNAQVVGADVVELCPVDGAIASDFAVARLSAKILAYKEFL